MEKIFHPSKHFKIPDDTLISPFLNPKDTMSELPFSIIDGFSLAHGIIPSESKSKIHIHPHVDQVTYVLSGRVILNMKGINDVNYYSINLEKNQCAISIGGEYFQLHNPFMEKCEVLYIVSPAYVFEVNDKEEVIYDDAIILEHTWNELENLNWQLPDLTNEKHSVNSRNKALARIKDKKLKND